MAGLSKELWVEAYLVSYEYPFSGLQLSYLHPTMGHHVDWDTVKFNPVEVLLSMDGVSEETEEFPGNYILYNKDDDDGDGVPDYDDGFNKDGIPGNEDDENTAEDDLVKIIPQSVQPTTYMSGTVTFDVTSGDSKVKIWEPNEYYPAVKQVKYKEISLPVDYNTPNDLPKTFYVEGIEESGGPRDVEFTLSYTKGGLTFEDRVNVTVVHVELFRDAGYTELLDDWPKLPGEDLLRSPKYMFGEDDPIYVQVKNIGTDPNVAENIYAAVAVKSLSSPYIYLSLQETGIDTQIFRNSDAGELLYLSESTDIGNRKTKVISEEVLYFWLTIPPGNTSYYKMSVDVMVDRAEVGTEWQKYYKEYCWCHAGIWDISTDWFGEQLYDNIGGAPGLVWFKDPNFKNADFDSKWQHWHEDTDSTHADAVDLASWSGHSNYGYPGDGWHFFRKNWFCAGLERSETSLGDSDADWLIFDTCLSLNASLQDLKNQLLTDGRCAHMFLGFWNSSSWKDDSGQYFATRLKEVGIKQAWFDYCEYRQKTGTYVRVFYAVDCMDESLAGPGPIEIRRDPTKDSPWTYEDYEKVTE